MVSARPLVIEQARGREGTSPDAELALHCVGVTRECQVGAVSFGQRVPILGYVADNNAERTLWYVGVHQRVDVYAANRALVVVACGATTELNARKAQAVAPAMPTPDSTIEDFYIVFPKENSL